MAGNRSLQIANKEKNDEFYTQLTDIEKELSHYKQYFKGKTVFCNCDDPEYSNFWKYFQLNFYFLGLKKLIATHYETEKPSYKMEIVAMERGAQMGIPDYVKTPLRGNGDFRSEECVEILKDADMVVTNPPFSLFREYVAQLIEYKKEFIIIGNQNAITYKEIFPLLQDNRMWLGYNAGAQTFQVPKEFHRNNTFMMDEKKFATFGNICWFTNVETTKRHESLTLFRTYDEAAYPKYDNYDAIEVGKVADIPQDYSGAMGVPITFLDKYNPEQFEIIGNEYMLNISRGRCYLHDKRMYSRIIIQRRRENEN